MRYHVDQTLFAVQFGFASDRVRGRHIKTFRLPVLHDDEMPETFNFIELKVAEHHKVHDEFSSRLDAPQLDGYLLKDKDGVVYANQYPVAAYQQTSDSANRRFRLYNREDSVIESLLTNPNSIYEYNLLTDVLEDMQRGIQGLAKLVPEHSYYKEAQGKIKLLQFLYDRTVEEFKKTYPGYDIDFKWVKYFSFSDVTLPMATIYKSLTLAQASELSGDQITQSIKDHNAFKITYSNDMVLGIENTRGSWNIFGHDHDLDVWRVYYVPKEGTEATQLQPLYPIEYFAEEDVLSASFCYLLRLRSTNPGNSTNNGQSLAELAANAWRRNVLMMPTKNALKALLEKSEIKSFDEYGAEFNLTKKNDDPYALVWAESSLLNQDETQRNIKALFFPPDTKPEVAIRVFKIFLSVPGYPLGGICEEALKNTIQDAEREIATEECNERAAAVTIDDVWAKLQAENRYVYTYSNGQALALERLPLDKDQVADEAVMQIIFKDRVINNLEEVHTISIPVMAQDMAMQCYLKVLKHHKPFSFVTNKQFITVIREVIQEKLEWMARTTSTGATS